MQTGYKKAKGGYVNIEELYDTVDMGIEVAEIEEDKEKMNLLKGIKGKLERGSYSFTNKERYAMRTLLREVAEPKMLSTDPLNRREGTLAYQEAMNIGFDVLPARASGNYLEEEPF